MLVSLLLFVKIFFPDKVKKFTDNLKKDSKTLDDYKVSVGSSMVWFSLVVLFVLFNVVPAILIANSCNGGLLHLIFSILFSDIYVFHYTLRKHVFKDGYCSV